MGSVLNVKSGKFLVVFEPIDVLDVIEHCCGEDVSRYLRDFFDRLTKEDREIEARINTDLDCYEEQLCSNSSAFRDILAEVENLKEEFGRTRINRVNVRKNLDAIGVLINNQI